MTDATERLEMYRFGVFVIALPGPLLGVIEALRQRLDPVSAAVAPLHVTVTGPLLEQPNEIARADLGAALADALPPFELTYGPARTFPNSSVIYVAVEPAEPVLRLRAIAHATGLFQTDLPFADAFVPHITVREWPNERAAGMDVRLEEIDAVVGRGQFVCSALELWRPDARARFSAVDAVALVGA